MRFKHRKWANPFFIVSLAIAGIFGVTAGVVNEQKQETPVVEKASATYDGTVYYVVDTSTVSNGNKMKVEWNNRGNNETEWKQQVEMTRLGDYYKDGWVVFKAVIPTQYNGVGWLQFQLYNSSDQWQWNDMRVTKQYNWTDLQYIDNKVCVSSSNRSWVDIYFYTLQPNGGRGSVTNQIKLSDEASVLVTCDKVKIYPGGGRHFVKWNTASDGSGISYQPGDNLDNSNKTLHLIQDWYTYQYSLNGGDWITMSQYGSQPEGYVTWFKSAEGTIFTTGQSLSFRRYFGSESAETVSPSAWEGGNYDTTYNMIIYTCTGQLEIKVTFEDGHTVYVPGYSLRSIFITHNGVTTKYHLTESDSNFYTTIAATIYPGDYIQGGYNGGAYELSSIKTGSGDFTYNGSATHHVTCNAPGVFTVWLLKYGDNNYPDVRFDMHEAETAKLYAQTFNSDIGSICVESGSTDFTTLKNKMGTSSSAANTEYRYYNSLTTAAKALIVAGSGDSDIAACVAKYNYILSKYGYGGEGQLVDFMNKSPSLSAINSFTPFNLIIKDDDNLSATIIIIALSISLLSITALSVLMVKKKKRANQ